MAVQLRGQSGWEAQAKASRERQAAELYEKYKLRPDDEVRFPRLGRTGSKVTGHPLGVAADGSVTCSAAGRVRAIVPEVIQVKMRGPRGGIVWEPLIPEEGHDG